MRLRLVLSIVLASLACSTASAQPRLWDVYSTSPHPFLNVTIDRYESDSLYLRSGFNGIAMHQDSIKHIVRRGRPMTAVGILVGAAMGAFGGGMACKPTKASGPYAALGDAIAAPFEATSCVLGVVVGALVGGTLGGVVGSTQVTNTEYRISPLDSEGKRKLLQRIASAAW